VIDQKKKLVFKWFNSKFQKFKAWITKKNIYDPESIKNLTTKTPIPMADANIKKALEEADASHQNKLLLPDRTKS